MIKENSNEKISWVTSIPFILFHFTLIFLPFIDITAVDVAVCIGFYYLRMFFITAGYHRYFSHRSFKMSRIPQFFMAVGGTLAMQKGPLWWASHHRVHHKYSDTDLDVHSPKKGFWWSHLGWILCSKYDEPVFEKIHDFSKYPELRILDRFYLIPPFLTAFLFWYFYGWGMLLVGFCLSTILLYHGTFSINSLAHVFGRRRYSTSDTSRNSFLLALITCGEGWHNNHHHYQASARQGFRWWELDLSFYALKFLALFRIVRDLKAPSEKALKRKLIADGYFDEGMFNAYYEQAINSVNSVKNEALTIYAKKQAALKKIMDETKVVADELAHLSTDSKKLIN